MSESKFDSIFKSKLESYEALPEEAIWSSIEDRLNKQSIWRSYYPYIASITLVLISIAFWVVFQKDASTTPSNPIDTTYNSNTTVSPSNPNETGSTNPLLPSSKKKGTPTAKEHTPSVDPIPLTPIAQTDSISTPVVSTTNKSDTSAKKPSVVIVKKKKPVYIVQQDTIVKTDTIQKKRRDR